MELQFCHYYLFIIISNQFFEPEITSTVTYTQNLNDSGSELDKILQHNEMRLERESEIISEIKKMDEDELESLNETLSNVDKEKKTDDEKFTHSVVKNSIYKNKESSWNEKHSFVSYRLIGYILVSIGVVIIAVFFGALFLS